MRLRPTLKALQADERGVAAIEAALVSGLLFVSLMNVVEVTRYAFISTQVEAVTQAAAQAAVITCDPNHSPVTQNCPSVNDAVTAAIHGSSLGDDVNLEGSLTESWYCVSNAETLQSASGQNANCPTGAKPGLYLRIRTTYAYQPLFPGLTVVEGFSDTIEHTAWMRTI
jgi:hypothetical protein